MHLDPSCQASIGIIRSDGSLALMGAFRFTFGVASFPLRDVFCQTELMWLSQTE